MGGSDDESNLIEVSVTQHAMFHYCNWRLWGNWQDKVAWKALGGQITHKEASLIAIKNGSRKGHRVWSEMMKSDENKERFSEMLKKRWANPEFRNRNLENLKRNQEKAVQAALSEEVRIKRKKALEAIKHQQGSKNSQYGTVWIINPDLQQVCRIKATDPIPLGWQKGRKMGWQHVKMST